MAQTYEVAHVRAQGQDMIIVIVPPSFGTVGVAQQRQAVVRLQSRAIAAGMRGTVVAVWDAGEGRLGLQAPTRWHAFFKSVGLAHICASVNRTLTAEEVAPAR